MKNLLSGVLFFCSFGIIISQDFLDIQPLSIEYDLVSIGDEIVMPFVDAQKLIDEDSQPRGAKPLRYGYNQLLSIDPNYDGQWDIAPNGDRVWNFLVVPWRKLFPHGTLPLDSRTSLQTFGPVGCSARPLVNPFTSWRSSISSFLTSAMSW